MYRKWDSGCVTGALWESPLPKEKTYVTACYCKPDLCNSVDQMEESASAQIVPMFSLIFGTHFLSLALDF